VNKLFTEAMEKPGMTRKSVSATLRV